MIKFDPVEFRLSPHNAKVHDRFAECIEFAVKHEFINKIKPNFIYPNEYYQKLFPQLIPSLKKSFEWRHEIVVKNTIKIELIYYLYCNKIKSKKSLRTFFEKKYKELYNSFQSSFFNFLDYMRNNPILNHCMEEFFVIQNMENWFRSIIVTENGFFIDYERFKRLNIGSQIGYINHKINGFETTQALDKISEALEMEINNYLIEDKSHIEFYINYLKEKFESLQLKDNAQKLSHKNDLRFLIKDEIKNDALLQNIYDSFKNTLISNDTKIKHFKGLFNGRFVKKVTWIGSVYDLLYFLYFLKGILKNKNYSYQKLYNSFTLEYFNYPFSEIYQSLKTMKNQVKNYPTKATHRKIIKNAFY